MTAMELVECWGGIGGERIHPEDREFVGDGAFSTDLQPVPWVGPLSGARAYLLYLNPGLSPDDQSYESKRPDFVAMLRENLSGEGPYVYLLDQFSDHPGYRWARATFGADVTHEDTDRICVLQLVAYHSKDGDIARRKASILPSSAAIRAFVRVDLLPKAQSGEVVLIVARASKLWGIDGSDETQDLVVYRGSECRRAFQTARTRGGVALRRHGIGR